MAPITVKKNTEVTFNCVIFHGLYCCSILKLQLKLKKNDLHFHQTLLHCLDLHQIGLCVSEPILMLLSDPTNPYYPSPHHLQCTKNLPVNYRSGVSKRTAHRPKWAATSSGFGGNSKKMRYYYLPLMR